jgi:DNA-directed RNA polymerase omega subunit
MKINPKDPTIGLSNQAAVDAIGNRYDLVLIAARRVRELHRGDARKVDEHRCGATLTALLEIEEGKVGRDYLYKETDVETRRTRKHRTSTL